MTWLMVFHALNSRFFLVISFLPIAEMTQTSNFFLFDLLSRRKARIGAWLVEAAALEARPCQLFNQLVILVAQAIG